MNGIDLNWFPKVSVIMVAVRWTKTGKMSSWNYRECDNGPSQYCNTGLIW